MNSVLVKAPFLSETVTVSAPPPALTTICVNRLRRRANSTEPFEPTSTWRIPGAPFLSFSVSLSLLRSPVSVSFPPAILALYFAAAGPAATKATARTSATERPRFMRPERYAFVRMCSISTYGTPTCVSQFAPVSVPAPPSP